MAQAIADQFDDVTRLLEKMGLAKDWSVVQPRRGGLRGTVWIQNVREVLNAEVALSVTECEDLDDAEKEQRIKDAIAKAKKP
jgi:hypothetical protein